MEATVSGLLQGSSGTGLRPGSQGSGLAVVQPVDWHTLFWAGGPLMQAEGYASSDPITSWPNETGESSYTTAVGPPTYQTGQFGIWGKPCIQFLGSAYLRTPAFLVNPTYPITRIMVVDIAATPTGEDFLTDGITNTGRNRIMQSSSMGGSWSIGASSGSSAAGVGPFTGSFGVRAVFDGSTGPDTLYLNGAYKVGATDSGSETLTGLTLAADYAGANNFSNFKVAFDAIYEGDIITDPGWPDLQAWILDQYNVVI